MARGVMRFLRPMAFATTRKGWPNALALNGAEFGDYARTLVGQRMAPSALWATATHLRELAVN